MCNSENKGSAMASSDVPRTYCGVQHSCLPKKLAQVVKNLITELPLPYNELTCSNRARSDENRFFSVIWRAERLHHDGEELRGDCSIELLIGSTYTNRVKPSAMWWALPEGQSSFLFSYRSDESRLRSLMLLQFGVVRHLLLSKKSSKYVAN